MKKIISMLVAMLMLLTMVPAFAAIEVDTDYPSKAYFNDLSSFADGATATTPFGANASYPYTYEFKDGQFSFRRAEGSTTSGLVYLFGGDSHEYDYMTFGYDIKFSGLTSNSGTAVFSNSPGTKTTGPTDTNPNAGTGWRFYKSGDHLSFTTKNAAEGLVLGNNGKPAIFFGTAQLEQDTFYTLKVFMDQVNKEYKAVIINADGTVQETGIDGKIQDVFYGFFRTDSQISASVNNETTLTLDNLFVGNSIFDMEVPETLAVNSNGTVSFNATIPSDISNPQLYINDTLVENLAITPQDYFSDYVITATLPDGTAFGDATVEIRGTRNGATVSKAANTQLNFSYKASEFVVDTPTSAEDKGLRSDANTGSTVIVVPEDDPGVWQIPSGTQIDITKLNPVMKGIVDFSFDFKPSTNVSSFNFRMTANTGNGYSMKWSSNNYNYYQIGKGYPTYGLGANVVVPKINEWNKFYIRVDFYNHTYQIYVNNTLADMGTFTDVDESADVAAADWTDRVQDVRFNMGLAGGTGYTLYDNFKFEEYNSAITAAYSATAKYSDGTSAVYEDSALTSVNLSGFDFAVPFTIDAAAATAANFSIVNSKGEAVSATYSYANGTVSATLAGNPLKTDDYKFVVSKNTTTSGATIGANFEIPFAINGDDKVLTPSDVSGEKINLSVYAGNANKVVFKVNDETVKTFAAPEADYLYEYAYTPTVAGKNVFDAYVYTDDGVNLVSSTFNYLVDATMMPAANNMNNSSGMSAAAGATGTYVTSDLDGTPAYKVTSKVGTVIDGVTNNDSSNSCTTAFTPGGNNAYRKMVTEFDIKPGENTSVNLEIGFALNGLAYSSGGNGAYATLSPRGSSPGIFSADGTILGTSKTFTPNTWYKVRQVIDFDSLTCTWYVDGEFLIQDSLENLAAGTYATNYPNWKDDIVVTNKYKVMVHPIDKTAAANGTPATVTLDNYVRYCPVDVPVVESITAGGVSLVNDVIATGTDAVTVTLDKDFYALAANNIAVTVDGEAVGTVAVADTKTFTVSGLANVAAGKKIEVKILKDNLSVSYRNNTAAVQADYVYNIYVGDSNGVCLYPLSVESATGSDLTAYAKYVNGSQSALNTYLIMTEYANDDKTLVSQTNFAPVAIEAGKVGAVSGYLGGITKAEGCNVMLWNTDFAPLLEAGALAQ